MASPIPGVPNGWQQFIVCVLFIVVAPLSALLIDLAIKGEVPHPDLYLTFALFIIGTGSASKSVATLALSILLSGAYLIAYGSVAALPECPHVSSAETPLALLRSYIGGLGFLALSLAERYNRHVAGGEIFWTF